MTRLNSRIDALLSEIPALLFDSDDARMAAGIEVNSTRVGKLIEKEDMMIAGTALAKGLMLVTSNTRHFCRIDGLQLEDRRDGTLEVREPRTEYRVNVLMPMRPATPCLPPVTLS